MNKITLYIILGFASLWVTSCVSYKAQYSEDWKNQNKQIDDPYFTLYLIGDAGNAPMDSSTFVFDYLKKQLDKETANSGIIWLGDNIYPVGLAPTDSPYHAEGKHRLMAQLRTMDNYKGYKYFVPGNHDWYTYGRVGLRRQELAVDSFLMNTPNPNNQNNFFLPDKGCGDPTMHELASDINLILMDSHWFLNDKAKSGDQSVCEVTNQGEYIKKLKSEIESVKDQTVILASHHPPYTYAHHGGKFPLKDDLFPLTQVVDWLYLPLPLLGTALNRTRTFVSEQDVNNPNYKLYRNMIVDLMDRQGRGIIASGHEHTLQFIEKENQYFIVSGAGTKNNKVGMGDGSKFSIGEKGYVKVTFYDPQKAYVEFIVPSKSDNTSPVSFDQVIELK